RQSRPVARRTRRSRHAHGLERAASAAVIHPPVRRCIMRDLALQAAGVLAILTAVAHGAIAELRVFANARIEPRRTRVLLRMVWQASTVDWIALGALLVAAPAFGSEGAR